MTKHLLTIFGFNLDFLVIFLKVIGKPFLLQAKRIITKAIALCGLLLKNIGIRYFIDFNIFIDSIHIFLPSNYNYYNICSILLAILS